MARMNVAAGAVCAVSMAACGVDELAQNEDFARFELDGQQLSFDVGREGAATGGAVFGFDDRDSSPHQHDPYNELMLAVVWSGRLLRFEAHDELGSGTFALERTRYARAGAPHVRFSLPGPDDTRVIFAPRGEGDTIELDLTRPGYVGVRFDRIELVDACDHPHLLEHGEVWAAPRTTEALTEDLTLASIGVTQEEADGGFHLTTDMGPFHNYWPSAMKGDDRTVVLATNECHENGVYVISVLLREGTQPGTYDLRDDGAPAVFAEVDLEEPFTADSPTKKEYIGVDGSLEVLRNDDVGGFVEVAFHERVTLIETPDDRNGVVDLLRIEGGRIKAIVMPRPEQP